MRKTLQRNGQPLQRFRRNVSTNWLRCFLSASHRAVSAACRTSAASGASAAFGFTDANDPIGDGIWRHPDDPGWISMGGAFGFRHRLQSGSPRRLFLASGCLAGYLFNCCRERRFHRRLATIRRTGRNTIIPLLGCERLRRLETSAGKLSGLKSARSRAPGFVLTETFVSLPRYWADAVPPLRPLQHDPVLGDPRERQQYFSRFDF